MNKLLIILCSIYAINCSTQTKQNIEGKWYLINKSGFAEFTITKDSLINQKVTSNFINKRKKGRATKIAETIILKDRILLLGKKQDHPKKYYTIMALALPKDNNYGKYIWNVIDSTASKKTLKKLNRKDKRQLFGYNLYKKEDIKTLKSKKPIEDMTIEDFKHYLKALSKNLNTTNTEYKKNTPFHAGGAATLDYQICLQTLLELGYNPVQNSISIDNMFFEYIEDEDILEQIKTLKGD